MILYKSVEDALKKNKLYPPYDCPYYTEDGLGNENCKAEGCECNYGLYPHGCMRYNEIFHIFIEEEEDVY